MVGSAGETGAKLLAGEYRERLLARLTPSFLARLDDFGAQCAPKGKVCLVPVEEGGVYAALWKLAEAAGAGLTVEQQSGEEEDAQQGNDEAEEVVMSRNAAEAARVEEDRHHRLPFWTI